MLETVWTESPVECPSSTRLSPVRERRIESSTTDRLTSPIRGRFVPRRVWGSTSMSTVPLILARAGGDLNPMGSRAHDWPHVARRRGDKEGPVIQDHGAFCAMRAVTRGWELGAQVVTHAGELGQQRRRNAAAELIEVLLRHVALLGPGFVVDPEQLLDVALGQVEPVEVERIRGREQPDRGVNGIRLALDPAYDPLDHARVLAEAGPDEAAVLTLAEPVHLE